MTDTNTTATTASDALSNAARLLGIKEATYRRTYGGIGGISPELGVAWTELARVIIEAERGPADV